MDNDIIEPTQLPATEITGRRSAVSSLGAASIALLAVLGLPAASEALMPTQTRKVQRRRNRSTLSAAKKKRKVGPAGPTGPTGPQGPGVSQIAINRYRGPEETCASGQRCEATASCAEAGQVSIAGGVEVTSAVGVPCVIQTTIRGGTNQWTSFLYCPSGSSAIFNSEVVCMG